MTAATETTTIVDPLDIFDLDIPFETLVEQLGPLAPEWEKALTDIPTAPAIAPVPIHNLVSRPQVDDEPLIREAAPAAKPHTPEKKQRLLTRVGKKVGAWATKAVVATAAFGALLQHHLPGDEASAPKESAPGVSVAAPGAVAVGQTSPKIEVKTNNARGLTVLDVLPDAVPQDGTTKVTVQAAPPTPRPAKIITVQPGNNLSALVRNTLVERGIDPGAPSADPNKTNMESLLDKTVQDNHIADRNRIVPGQQFAIPDDRPPIATETVVTEENVKNPFQAMAVRAAADLMPLIQRDANGNIQIVSEPGNTGPAYSWGASINIHGLHRFNQAFPGNQYSLNAGDIGKVAGRYWDNHPNSMGYAVDFGTKNNPGAERYIDDGTWQAMARVLEYADQVKRGETPDATALAEAQSMLNIAMQNYNPEVGLSYWKKQSVPTENNHGFNTVSTATSVELALLVNQFTPKGSPQYKKNLDFAVQAYKGVRAKMQDPADHLYYDGFGQDGVLDKRKFTYNAGVMISSGMWLYEATGDKHYLDQAEETAKSSLETWDKDAIRLQEPALISIFYDRLYNLRQVTKDEALRDQIGDAITDYAMWYGNLTKIADAQLPGSNWAQGIGTDTFASTKLHVTSLAALIHEEENNNKGPIESVRYTIPQDLMSKVSTQTPKQLRDPSLE